MTSHNIISAGVLMFVGMLLYAALLQASGQHPSQLRQRYDRLETQVLAAGCAEWDARDDGVYLVFTGAKE